MKRLRSRSLNDLELHVESFNDTAIPPFLSAWLANALLLKPLPFQHMVPLDTMLPLESLRTFALDAHWLEAFAAGAYSVGRSLSAEQALDAGTFPSAFAQAAQSAEQGSSPMMMGPVTGFLLRSQVVKGWPNMMANAYNANQAPLTQLRFETLNDTLMIGLFAGVMASFVLSEPPEGLHFGFIDTGSNLGQKNLRYVTVPAGATGNPTPTPGSQLDPSIVVKPTYRANNVLRVSDLASQIAQTLETNHANEGPDGHARAFTSAEFALEMIEGVEQVRFDVKP